MHIHAQVFNFKELSGHVEWTFDVVKKRDHAGECFLQVRELVNCASVSSTRIIRGRIVDWKRAGGDGGRARALSRAS